MPGEYYAGCIGCVDYARNTHVCDYLLNNEHCRPCKVDRKGCELYSAIPRTAGTEDGRRTWSTEEAARMLAEGVSLTEIAKKLGANRNSIKAWIVQGCPAGEPQAPTGKWGAPRKKRGVWDEERYRKLYAQGLNDVEAAARMGLTKLTIWKHRDRLGLPPNGGRNGKKKGVQV